MAKIPKVVFVYYDLDEGNTKLVSNLKVITKTRSRSRGISRIQQEELL
jgi:hypothetical protein